MLRTSQKGIVLFLVITVICTMSLSLVGCQGNGIKDEDTTEQQEETNKDSKETDKGKTEKEEPVTLTMIAPPFEKTFAAGIQDDPVMKKIEEETGVRLDITPENALADAKAKLASMMASRNLPDLVYTLEDSIRKQIVTSKLALNLDPYVDELSNVEKNRPGVFDIYRQKFSQDIDGNKVDGLYWIGLNGTQGNLYRPKVGFYIRWDLYKELGCPEIETYEDYIPIVKKMLELEPENKNGKKNYGVSAWFANAGGFGPWALDKPFMWDAGVNIEVFENREFVEDTDDIRASMTNPDSMFWRGVEWWNKAYRARIVDPDAFTNKWADYLERIGNQNRVMLSWADFTIDGGESQFIKDGTPEKGYIALPSPKEDSNTRIMASYAQYGNRHMCISANTEYPEKAVELLNYLCSWESTILIYNGIEGEHWDVVDGKPQLKPETIKGLSEDPDYRLKTGVFKYHNIAGMGAIDTWPKYDVPANFQYLPNVFESKLTMVEKDACDYYGVQYPGQIVMKGKDNIYAKKGERFMRFNVLSSPSPEITQRNKEIASKLTEIYQQDVFEAVLAKSEEKFQQEKARLIEKAIKVGGEELFEFHKQRFYESE